MGGGVGDGVCLGEGGGVGDGVSKTKYSHCGVVGVVGVGGGVGGGLGCKGIDARGRQGDGGVSYPSRREHAAENSGFARFAQG